MKKLSSLVALALAALMLMLPMGALAEAAAPAATVIQIANPSISYNGETRSMPGLALQLALCESDDASLAQIIADVLVNNQNAGSAMLQIDSAMNLVGLVGGMSGAYSLSMNDMLMLADSYGMSAYGAQAQQLMTMAENWTLPNDIMTIIENRSAEFTIADEGVSVNASGVEMQYTRITGDLTNAVIDIMTAVEQDELVLAILQMIDPTMTSLDLVASSGIGNGNGFRLDAKVGADVNGLYTDCVIDVIIYSQGVDQGTMRLTFTADNSIIEQTTGVVGFDLVNPDGSSAGGGSVNYALLPDGYNVNGSFAMDGETITIASSLSTSDTQDLFSLSFNSASEYSEYPTILNMAYSNTKNGMSGSISASLEATDYGDTTGITLAGNYSVTDTGFAADGKLTLSDPYSGDTVITLSELTIDAANGGFGAVVVYEDPYTTPASFSLELTPSAPENGALYSGVLALGLYDGSETIGATVDLNVLTAEVDTDAFYIDPATAISLLTMDELQLETANTELNAILGNIGSAIMNAYPDFFN